jgi:exodeoxyribonuclease V alpha subunit
MSDALRSLLEAGRLPPLCYYFARFVARGCGLDEDSVVGRSAALVSLRNLQGDVCVDLTRFAGRALFDDSGDAEHAAALPKAPALARWRQALTDSSWVGGPGSDRPLILDGSRLYLNKYWRFEQQVARALLDRMEPITGLEPARLRQGLERLFPSVPELAVDRQKVAAAISATRRFAVISGGPGTGKTTTVVKLLALLLEQSATLRIALAAPTGKAAARLSAAMRAGKARVSADAGVLSRIPDEARTVHRLLGVGADNSFRHDSQNPLLIDCLVVDEASMIDLPLMARLLAALPPAARVILLGDRDQLASVEAGSVLGDITGHGRELAFSPAQQQQLQAVGALPPGGRTHTADGSVSGAAGTLPAAADAVGLLRVSYRFKDDSGIGALSKAVNAGGGERALALLRDAAHADLDWLDASADGLRADCLERAIDQHAEVLRQPDVGDALGLFERYRVLAALHRGPFGVEEINRLIAVRLRSRGLIAAADDYHGKPVMVTANDYEVGLFNGDIGLLWRGEDRVLRAWFALADDQVRAVPVRQLPEHVCAYALTVHKSQGSEFDEVLLVLPFEHSPVLTRELIYTGITRARQRVSVHGNPATFVEGCRRRVERSSGLAERLGWPVGTRDSELAQ